MINKWSTQAVKESEDAECTVYLATLHIETQVKDLINFWLSIST